VVDSVLIRREDVQRRGSWRDSRWGHLSGSPSRSVPRSETRGRSQGSWRRGHRIQVRSHAFGGRLLNERIKDAERTAARRIYCQPGPFPFPRVALVSGDAVQRGRIEICTKREPAISRRRSRYFDWSLRRALDWRGSRAYRLQDVGEIRHELYE
jgi:hypothetical protein